MSYYAVKKGIEPGIYNSWEECSNQIDGFPGAEYKKFKTMEEANDFLNTKTIFMGSSKVVRKITSETVLKSDSLKPSLGINEKSEQQQSGIDKPMVSPDKPMVSPDKPMVLPNKVSTEDLLSPEQKIALQKYKDGNNVFITGPGGTGKSFLIKTIKADLEQREIKHVVCGLTGCASVLLNCCAKTIHSWSGIGLANGEIHEIVDKAIKNRKASENWKTTRVLIVDEVSMMSVKIFNALNKIGQTIRRCPSKPFGGIQLVFIGDFFQLPPVGRYTEPETTMFCFQSAYWFSTFSKENHVVLKTLFRQKDPVYIKVLDEVRQGVISEESVALLTQRTQVKCENSPTKLFPRNADADRINQIMYMKITDDEYKYDLKKRLNMQTYAESGKPIPVEILARCLDLSKEEVDQHLELLIENSKINKELRLKKGAFVMCLANLDIDSGICNGSQGTIVDFVVSTNGIKYPVVKFLNGITMRIDSKIYQHGDYPTIGVEQLPLRLAWAFTIHKSQGITLDIAEMDLGSNIFEYGQSYVGLSRVRSLEGLYLSGFNPRKIKTNPAVSDFYKQLE